MMSISFPRTVQEFKRIAPYAVTLLFFVLLLVVKFSGFTWASGITREYLSVHIVLEFVGILVSFAIFTVGWATYHNARASDILVLSIASFAVGILDLGHTLSFTGMPDFFGPSGPNKAIGFWLASRATGSLAFLYVAIARPRAARIRALHWMLFSACLAWVVTSFWFILNHSEQLPTFYVPGLGLTAIKVQFEWGLILISFLAGILLFVGAEKRENMSVRWMACASLLYGMCGYFFTQYQDFEDIFNFTGHCYKAISYLFLYRAIFVECVSKPFESVQRLASQAEASNLSKSRFLANVSHEFRTPLGVISGFADLLFNSGKLEPPLQTWAQTIVRNSKQLSLLIDDLLDLAKAETEKIQVHLTKVDILQLVSQVKQGLEMQARNGVLIEIHNSVELPAMAVTDELRLRQILINVLGNAIKFTSRGEISIRLSRLDPERLEISVEDTGIGIALSDTGGLFQPFAQVSNPNNRNFGGTGLGLSLSRKLAEILGGALLLKWSQPDVGSCFAIQFRDFGIANLSVPNAELTVQTPNVNTSQPPYFAGRHVLIAEDSDDNRMLLNRYLQPTGIEITFAENGRVAIDLLTTAPFDLILMDIQMPEMDGFEATANLREQGWQGPIVALTAHALQPERERAMKNGFTNYLVKPIKKEALWAAIEQSLSPLKTKNSPP